MRSRRPAALALLGVMLCLVIASSAIATPTALADDQVVLPSRVANAISAAQNQLSASGASVRAGKPGKAAASLKALQRAVVEADKAARQQMSPTPNSEADAPSGPDSVIAVLTLDQTIIKTLARLFDARSGAIVDAETHALFATLNTRDKLLNTVIGLPAEGAGADYADGMPDTIPGYDSEVATLTNVLSTATLSAGGSKVIQAALAQSKRTQARVNNAFGGGE
jgi:hypothetical protein